MKAPVSQYCVHVIPMAFGRMCLHKAAGHSSIITEMLKPTGEAGAAEVCDVVKAIVSESHIPIDWQESYIVHLYKAKGIY